MSKLHKCDCQHAYQDEKYGAGVRVMNKTKPERMYRCTVCSKQHEIKEK